MSTENRNGTQILIVEDDSLVAEMTRGMLEDMGYTVIGQAEDGWQAIEMTQSLRPNVVLMDIEMPDMNGLEATRRIYECCPTPVVILTAYETPTLVEEANAAGVGAYLVKPPKAREMERAITIAKGRFDDIVKLNSLNAELQARNEELDAFAHTVSNKLQDPLSLIIGFAEYLKEESRLPDNLYDCLNAIVRNGRKMHDIINELQTLMGVRKADVRLHRLNMARIVAEARQRLTYMMEKHEAEIIYPQYWPEAIGYGPWIEEVWTSYISNAIKYGGNPPRIQLGGTARSDGMARFWVRDNGPGLTAEEQEQLFIPFTRLHKAQQITGHGLGLSIARRIVERLGGKVSVESEGIAGQGCVFTFTLPLVEKDYAI